MTISAKAQQTTDRLNTFMEKNVYPNNDTYHNQIEDFGNDRWQVVPIVEELKKEEQESASAAE